MVDQEEDDADWEDVKDPPQIEKGEDEEEIREKTEKKKKKKDKKAKADKKESKHDHKRRKLTTPPDEAEGESPHTAPEEGGEAEEDGAEDPAPTTRRAPTPDLPGALPSFPLPTRPDAPSKLALALQGLDRALVDAQIVDPSATRSLDLYDGGDSVLSEKMRKRLRELGITELFAGAFLFSISFPPLDRRLSAVCDAPDVDADSGVLFLAPPTTVQTALLPFLLPPAPAQRMLYSPYDPPRDACVSAPTGSGKTLAYVVPIVEVRALLFVPADR
jgi:ATP-dependent RNA helicase DDX51/DBP6